jgi:hypothetical protein
MVEWIMVGIMLFALYFYDAVYNEKSELYKHFHDKE